MGLKIRLNEKSPHWLSLDRFERLNGEPHIDPHLRDCGQPEALAPTDRISRRRLDVLNQRRAIHMLQEAIEATITLANTVIPLAPGNN